MECVVIKSRLLASAAYYPQSRKLCVWFHNGRSAVHDNVEEGIFRNLTNADSPGLYYSYYIAGRSLPSKPKVPLSRRIAVASVISLGMIFASGVSEAGRTDKAAVVASSDVH